MSAEETPKKKDNWDIAEIVGKLLIPIVVAAATLGFELFRRASEGRQKNFDLATEILKVPKSPETEQLRSWAVGVLQNQTGIAESKGAVEELQQGTQLPSLSQLQLPNPGQLRIAIIRLAGTPTEQSEKIRSALAAEGYTDVTMTERTQDAFPANAEVRFYYLADSVNAKSLSDYMSGTLGIPNRLNDRSADRDVSRHRLGDLHIYIR